MKQLTIRPGAWLGRALRRSLRVFGSAGVIAALLYLATPEPALAHALSPSLLELTERDRGRFDVRFKTPVLVPAGGAELAPELPLHCHSLAPPAASRDGMALVLAFAVDCGSHGLAGQQVGIAGLADRSTDALVRVQLADGRLVREVLSARRPSLRVPIAEPGGAVAERYLWLGVEHIWLGPDHLLFVLGLLLLVRGRRALLITVTAFTLGHSITLSLAAVGWVALPAAAVEVAIAISILLLAVELARPGASAGEKRLWREHPWWLAVLFGLLHGLGFAGALVEIGLPVGEIVPALISFNLGIEAGQILFIAAALLVRHAGRSLWARWPAWAVRAPIYVMGTLASSWLFERAAGWF